MPEAPFQNVNWALPLPALNPEMALPMRNEKLCSLERRTKPSKMWVLPRCAASHGAASPHALRCPDVLTPCSFLTTHPVLSQAASHCPRCPPAPSLHLPAPTPADSSADSLFICKGSCGVATRKSPVPVACWRSSPEGSKDYECFFLACLDLVAL